MPLPKDINEYLRAWAPELGERILQTYPPLQDIDDVASPLTGQLLRKPFPAQTLAMMEVAKRLRRGGIPKSRDAALQESHGGSKLPICKAFALAIPFPTAIARTK